MKKTLFLAIFFVLTTNLFAENLKIHIANIADSQSLVISLEGENSTSAEIQDALVETIQGRTFKFVVSEFISGPGALNKDSFGEKEVYIIHNLTVKDVKRIKVNLVDKNNKRFVLEWKRVEVGRAFWALNIALIGVTIYDIEATFYAIGKYPNCWEEANPLMRPFVKRGRPAVYAVQAAISAGLVYLSYQAKKEDSQFWWIIPTVVISAHGIAGTHNLRLTWGTSF